MNFSHDSWHFPSWNLSRLNQSNIAPWFDLFVCVGGVHTVDGSELITWDVENLVNHMLWKMGYNSNLTTGDVKKTYEKMEIFWRCQLVGPGTLGGDANRWNYPPVNSQNAGWNIPIFSRECIFKKVHFPASHVSLTRGYIPCRKKWFL